MTKNEAETHREKQTEGAGAAPAGSPVLQVSGVVKKYGATTAVDDVSLTLGRGEVAAIVGPSGCGKSTLLRIIAGLATVDAGRVELGGKLVSGDDVFVPVEKRGVGIVFQDLALFPHLSVERNVGFGLRYVPKTDVSQADRIAQMLELVGLADKSHRGIHELSGGEQQRVAIARALVLNPEVVLLDEPFSHLDRGLARQVRDEAMDVLRAAGASAILVTHDQEEAMAVCDQLAVMRGGSLIQADTPATVYHHPADEFVATFLGEADFVDGERMGDIARTALGDVPVARGVDGPVRVMMRPHDLTAVPAHDDVVGMRGVVQHSEFRGSSVVHKITLEDGTIVRALAAYDGPINLGDAVVVPCPQDHPLSVVPPTIESGVPSDTEAASQRA